MLIDELVYAYNGRRVQNTNQRISTELRGFVEANDK